MKVALIHDWMTGMRGGEKVLELLCRIYPKAKIFTLVHYKNSMSPVIEEMDIQQSELLNLPFARAHFRSYLPLFPRYIERFDLSGFDLIISSSHCVAKGIRVPEGALHISYCYTPMRYMWDMYEEYKRGKSIFVKAFMAANKNYLRKWDVKSSQRVDHFVAISNHVADRIKRHYQRESDIIYPPVNTDFYTLDEKAETEEFYLIVSALVPYKRVDLAINAFKKSGKELVVIGTGSDEKHIKGMGAANIRILGNLHDEELRNYYRRAKALIFPGEEDFGITPLESMACGRPVIAFARGGALETVIEGKTGVFFREQTEEALIEAVDNFETMSFTSSVSRRRALEFSNEIFMENIREFVDQRYREFQEVRKSAQSS